MSDWDRFAETVLGTIKGVRDALTVRIEALEKREPLRGEPGEKGADGLPGRDGLNGKDGERGADGQPGRDGINGKDGERGLDGKDGLVGPRGEPGINGKDGAPADPTLIQELQAEIKALRADLLQVKALPDTSAIDAMIGARFALFQVPKDGKDGIDGKAGADGKDGKPGKDGDRGLDGKSLTVDDVAPLITKQIEQAMAKVDMPKDGIGVHAAHVDTTGRLILTYTDGRIQDLGFVKGDPGRDGQPGVPGGYGKKGEDGKDGIDGRNGKDGANGLNGKDGLGFDDMTLVFDATKGYVLRFERGTLVKEWPVPIPFDAGVWKAGAYPAGAGVTRRGSFFIAQKATSAPPDEPTPESRDWRLAVKSGRDGKPGNGRG